MTFEEQLRERFVHQVDVTESMLPPVAIVVERAKRQRLVHRAAMTTLAAILVTAAAVMLPPRSGEVTLHNPSAQVATQAPADTEEVLVPDGIGLTLAEAQARLAAAGLSGGPTSGGGWSDPADPNAVVVHQAPPAGTAVQAGDAVGFRTALIDAALCRAFDLVGPRQGDAVELARDPGYWDALRQGRAVANPALAAHIDSLLDHQAAGRPLDEAPPLALDSVAIHHDACSLLAQRAQ